MTDAVKSTIERSRKEPASPPKTVNTIQAQKTPNVEVKGDRTFLIGDSVFKGIQRRGLNNKTDINSGSGATINLLNERLSEVGTHKYSNVVLYIGGNDVSNGKSSVTLRAEIRDTTLSLQRKQCCVYLCTICPRQDVDVRPYNNEIREVCRETGAVLIECHNAFVYGDGTTVRHFYNNDGIHLNLLGTKTLVFTVNKKLHIVKRPKNDETPRQQATTFGAYAGRQYRVRHYADDRGLRSDSGHGDYFTPVNRRSRPFQISPGNSSAASSYGRRNGNAYRQ